MKTNRYQKSLELHESGSRYLFDAIRFARPILESGKGSYVIDVDGNSYLDLNSGQFCAVFGHSYEPFTQLVSKQLGKLFHTSTATLSPEIFSASKRISEVTSEGLNKTIFLSTGAEANECAMRYARRITGKTGIMAFSRGYHGLTLGTQHLTMSGRFAYPNDKDNYLFLDLPYECFNKESFAPSVCDEILNNLEDLMRRTSNKTAAFILEPILGVAGMVFLPSELLTSIFKICRRNKVLIIVDECQTGFARCGSWFMYQQANEIPDILVCAKAAGLGLPVSFVTFREELIDQNVTSMVHFSSHQNEPLSASVVSFVIDTIQQNELIERSMIIGEYFFRRLLEVQEKVSLVVNARHHGLMLAFDIDESIHANNKSITSDLIGKMEDNGVLMQAIRQGRTFRIIPNLFILEKDIDFFAGALLKSVREVEEMISN